MPWNWQLDTWPEFLWNSQQLTSAEADFREGAGVFIGTSQHLCDEARARLSVEILSLEAIDTSAIEGEQLDRASVQSSIQKQLGLAVDGRHPKPAEAGIAEMMVDLYGRLADPLDAPTLFHWHGLIMRGRNDVSQTGGYRRDDEPMQIVSGALHDPRVHFEAPPSARVSQEMSVFLHWLRLTGQGGSHPLPPVTRAGVAHLWFESIHPFEDGNGRLGRAISEKVLAQGLSVPSITGMAGTLLKHRKAYYSQLERASQTLEITEWLSWFAERALEAQKRTLGLVTFTLVKTRLLDRLRPQLNDRQAKALLRLFAAGPDGFTGGLSAANYMSITGATTATATRDLAGLVEMKALIRTGERKSTRYFLALD